MSTPATIEITVPASPATIEIATLAAPLQHTIPTQYAKYHLTAPFTLASPNVWEPVNFDTTPAAENSFGITLADGGVHVLIEYAGHYQVNGCLRPLWTGANGTQATVACRITASSDDGTTWTEKRCLQSVTARIARQDELGVLFYNGSVKAQAGDMIRLEMQASSVEMILQGWTGFDLPVSATINIFAVGK